MKYHVVEIGFSGDADQWCYSGVLNSFDTLEQAAGFIIKYGKEEKWFIKIGDKKLPDKPRPEDYL